MLIVLWKSAFFFQWWARKDTHKSKDVTHPFEQHNFLHHPFSRVTNRLNVAFYILQEHLTPSQPTNWSIRGSLFTLHWSCIVTRNDNDYSFILVYFTRFHLLSSVTVTDLQICGQRFGSFKRTLAILISSLIYLPTF